MVERSIIQQVAGDFLKNYYKSRPRNSEGVTTYEQALDINLVANGCHTFVRPDGTRFISVFEVIGVEDAEEVKYVLLKNILRWDVILLSSISLFVIFLTCHLLHFNLYFYAHIGFKIIFGICVGLILYWIFFQIIQFFPKYRFLFAVEKMKKFESCDEKWLVLSDELCDYTFEPFYNELLRQSTQAGLGVLSVDSASKIHLHTTPARLEFLAEMRPKKQFYLLEKLKNADLALKISLPEKILLFQKTLRSKQNAYSQQLLMSSFCLVLIFALWAREYSLREKIYADEVSYQAEREQDVLVSMPEPMEIAPLKISPKSALKDDKIKVAIQKMLPKDEFTARGLPEKSTEGLYLSIGKNNFISYDCDRIYSLGSSLFVIQESTFDSPWAAKKRVQILNKLGIRAGCISMSCFGLSKKYTVFLDEIFVTKSDAQKNYLRQREQLAQNKINVTNIAIINLTQEK